MLLESNAQYYKLFCDESCHLEHDNSDVMVLGTICCPTLKAESERLLELAKRAVEMAIETDEQTALDYINEQTGEH